MRTDARAITLLHPTRRQFVAGVFAASAGSAMTASLWGQSKDNAMKSIPSTEANKARTTLHQEIDYNSAPQRIYGALLSSKDFTTFSGTPAEIDPKVGRSLLHVWWAGRRP